MATPTTTHDETSRGLGLSGVLEIVRRRRALAVLPFLFVLTAVASLALFLPGLWSAKAQILVDRPQIAESVVKSTVATDLQSRLLTLSQEILSPSRLMKIADDYNLYPKLRRTHSPEALAEKMRKDIKVEVVDDGGRTRDPRSGVFTISYTTGNPQVAMSVTNTLANLYIAENSKLRAEQAVDTSSFLDTQLNDVRKQLVAQERRIADYKERYIGELPEQRDANLRMLEQAQARLQYAQENRRRAVERQQMLTSSLGELDQSVGGAGGALGPNPSPREATAARLNLVRQELAQLETRYSDKYPDIIAMKDEIRGLEQRLAAMPAAAKAGPAMRDGKILKAPPQNAYVASLMQQLDQAQVEAKASADEIAALNGQVARYNRRIENTPKREEELSQITRDYETTRQLFQSLLAKRGEAGIATDLEQLRKSEQFRVLEPARLPTEPAGPNRLRLLLVGLILALGASGIAVVLAENVDTSYRRVEEVRSTVAVPVLSAIPRITTERDRLSALRNRRVATAAVGLGLLLVAGSSFAVAHDNTALVSLLITDSTKDVKR